MVLQQAVTVEVSTLIRQGNQQEEFAFQEPGQLVQMGNQKRYLRYVERQNELETPIQFRFDQDQVILSRHGQLRSTMVFDQHQATISKYPTVYGVIDLTVRTQDLKVTIDWLRGQGEVWIKYQLLNQGQLLGNYQIKLQFKA